jgi:hypothetical protein
VIAEAIAIDKSKKGRRAIVAQATNENTNKK